MLTTEDNYNLMAKSQEALNRLKTIRYLEEEEQQKGLHPKPNYARILLEEFDESNFKIKIERDKAYYDVLLHKLEESKVEQVQVILEGLLDNVKQIYEHINIKPKIYASNRLPDKNESDDIIYESASRIINDYISRNYYQLSKDNRVKNYEQTVKTIATELVVEQNIELDEAIEFATKVSVVNRLLENINFPLIIKSEIENSLVSEQYGEIFEQEELVNLWESFKNKSYKFAKIVAVVI